jgi:hypothetical protein
MRVGQCGHYRCSGGWVPPVKAQRRRAPTRNAIGARLFVHYGGTTDGIHHVVDVTTRYSDRYSEPAPTVYVV